MTSEEFRSGIRRWAARGSYVGLLAALAAGGWAMLTEDPGDVRDLAALLLILPVYGALGAAMLFIRTSTFAELRASVGLRHSLTVMAGLFAGVMVAGVVAKLIGGW